MTPDAADLANLHDLVLPPAVQWWPLSPGWWVLFAGLLAVLALVLTRLLLRYRANAYRREARRTLRALAAAPPPDMAARIADLLRRVALVTYPRTAVAGLTGAAWTTFLARSGGFPTDAGERLGRAALDPAHPLAPDEAKRIVVASGRWISRHRRREGAR
jgi:hypothetical protein